MEVLLLEGDCPTVAARVEGPRIRPGLTGAGRAASTCSAPGCPGKGSGLHGTAWAGIPRA